MRGIVVFSAWVLAASSAVAAIPVHPAAMRPQHSSLVPTFQLGGSVYLQRRPLPGSVLHYPGLFTPLRGPHGGWLAERQQHVGQS